METSLSVHLQQAWLLSQIKKRSPPPPPSSSNHFPSSPTPWISSSSDFSLDPSSPDFFWSDFAEVSDSWNPPPVAPAVSSSSSSDGAVWPLPKARILSATQAASASSDDAAFVSTSDAKALPSAGGVFTLPSDRYMPAPQLSEAASGVESLDGSVGFAPGASSFDFSSLEDDVFMDHTMDYISDMLMDEQMEDRKCMEQECSAYQAIVNGFYEILGEDSSSHSSCTERSSSPTDHEVKDDYSWIDDILVADPALAAQTAALAESLPWQHDSLSSSSSQQDSKSWSFVPSSSGSSYSQDSSVYTSGSHEDGSWSSGNYPEGASVLHQSYSAGGVGALANGFTKTFPVESSMQAFPTGFHPGVDTLRVDSGLGNSLREPPSQVVSHNNTDLVKFRRVKSEDYNHHAELHPPRMNGNASDYGTYKRATSEKLYDKLRQSQGEVPKFFADSKHSSDGSHGSANGSHGSVNGALVPRVYEPGKIEGSDPDVSVGDRAPVKLDENFSFVKNKDLNAEKHSKMYKEWSPEDKSFVKKAEAHTNGLYVKRSGKPEPVDLRSLLVSCAQAVASNDLRKANELLQEIRQHASPYGNAGQRLAHYFAEALNSRISGTGARLYTAMSSNRPSALKMLKAFHLFVGICPYAMISHYFANVSILKAAEGASRLHIVDYGILYGVQWPCLISALADREGGPPFLRITGIEFPQPGLNPAERLEETGRRLAEYAKTYNVPFEFTAIASKWEDVEPARLCLEEGEVLVVNCIHRLHHLLDESVVAASPRRKVLSRMHSLNPDILVIAALNAGYNAPFFVSRFREAMYHYSSKFDIMDTTVDSDNPERLMLEKEVMGRDILNIVACEGPERVERPETYRQWQARLQRAGFERMALPSSLVFKARALVKGFYHKDFGVDEDSKWLLLGWKGRIVDALSAWRPIPASTRK